MISSAESAASRTSSLEGARSSTSSRAGLSTSGRLGVGGWTPGTRGASAGSLMLNVLPARDRGDEEARPRVGPVGAPIRRGWPCQLHPTAHHETVAPPHRTGHSHASGAQPRSTPRRHARAALEPPRPHAGRTPDRLRCTAELHLSGLRGALRAVASPTPLAVESCLTGWSDQLVTAPASWLASGMIEPYSRQLAPGTSYRKIASSSFGSPVISLQASANAMDQAAAQLLRSARPDQSDHAG